MAHLFLSLIFATLAKFDCCKNYLHKKLTFAMNILYLFIYFSVVFCAIPISQLVTSKFKYLRDQKPIEEPVKLQLLHLQSVNDKVMKYNKLGSNYNLVVDQVKAHSAPEVYKTEPEVEKVTTSSSSDTVEPSVIASDYEIKSARTFINDFLKFKTQQLLAQSVGKEANPRLSTSIKNYDNALNHPYDLKFFTNKVIQETKEETDFQIIILKSMGRQVQVFLILKIDYLNSAL